MKIEDYISKAKQLKDVAPPFDSSEIENILDGVDAQKSINSKKFYGRIISMTIILLAALGLWLGYPSSAPNYSAEQTAPAAMQIAQNIQTYSISDSKVSSDNDKSKVKTKISKALRGKDALTPYVSIIYEASNPEKIISNPNRTLRENNITTYTIGANKSGRAKEIDLLEPASVKREIKGESIVGLRALELNSTELKKYGIIINDSIATFTMETIDRIHPIPLRNDTNYRNSKSKLLEKNYPTNGDTFIIKKNFTINLNENIILNNYVDFERRIRVKSKSEDIIYYDTTDNNIFGKKLSKEGWYSYNPSEIHKNSFKMPVSTYDSLVAVCRIGEIDKIAYYDGTKSSDYSKITPLVVAYRYNKIDKKRIIRDFYSSLLYKDNLKKAKENSESSLKNSSSKILFDNFSFEDYDEWIPIEVNFDSTKLINRIVFWFLPTQEFIDSLPDRYKNDLTNELYALQKLKNGAMNKSELCSSVPEESFFGTCHDESGAIILESLAPNPVSDGQSKINFTLNQSRTLKIDIHDINGAYIGNLLPLQKIEKGEHILPLNLKDVKNGVYLISIRSDKGEIVSSKLIIE